MSKKFYQITVFILVVTLIIVGNLYRKERVNHQENYESFLTELNLNLYHAIDYSEKIQEKQPRGESLDDYLRELEDKMMRLYYLFEFGGSYLNLNIPEHFFYQSPNMIIEGFHISEEGYDVKFPPFDQDGKLNREELLILETMTDYMKKIKKGIKNSSNKVNTDLPEDEFEQLIQKHISHHFPETYFDAINK
ncbi:hypothetical protein [Pontibacillus sp. HMF3514]|uniref:hypothetical protein n=1 Tax=Pontibacillus sp. HMF3514 TaxID=2692425 RepID=UPI00131F8116|nr:hypothetical protein [Pontibacillus sp. HMF3514]QHE52733.1 hypothetical protein GS400_12145 [Pontibacillus sp. HMF3514]